jgi:uracil DNA glycosylase
LAVAYETQFQAGKIARTILQSNHKSSNHGRVVGYSFVSVQFISDDCTSSGNPIFLLVLWGTHAQNIKNNSNASMFVRNQSWYEHPLPGDRGRMDHPRFTLFGRVEMNNDTEYEAMDVCMI